MDLSLWPAEVQKLTDHLGGQLPRSGVNSRGQQEIVTSLHCARLVDKLSVDAGEVKCKFILIFCLVYLMYISTDYLASIFQT